MKSLSIVLVFILGINQISFAQQSSGSFDWTGPQQDYTPTAMELGRYGKTPVNYFTGLPTIVIPLTELRAKNYTLPVYLSYHAGGNKPDNHPGWVGQGWSLRAGGCVNRVINGKKDDMCKAEYNAQLSPGSYNAGNNVGYYYRAESVQNTDWDNITTYCDSLDYTILDRDPDEFQICLEDFQASCYISGPGGQMTVVSKGNEDAKVEVELATGSENLLMVYQSATTTEKREAKRYNYFKKVTLTRQDGTRYIFGGDDTAIEYSISLYPRYISDAFGHPHNVNEWNAFATANTWFLVRIERPDGEVIRFHYKKDGTPIIKHDRHYSEQYYRNEGGNYYIYTDDTRYNPELQRNISFSLIKPSYLSLIESKVSRDSVVFHSSRTIELKDSITQEMFYLRAGNYSLSSSNGAFSFSHLKQEDYYLCLDGVFSSRDSMTLHYTSDTTRRLQLLNVDSHLDGEIDSRFQMQYNNVVRLPKYHSRQTDSWGFYNGMTYSFVQLDTTQKVRLPDPTKMQAEILTALIYPTGGRSEYIFEPNTYSREMEAGTMALLPLASDASGGGLRIKEIRDIAKDGKVESRVFSYSDSTGCSSGVSAGLPRYFLHGKQRHEYKYKGFPSNFSPQVSIHYNDEYFAVHEEPVRPLATTDGSYVTYSRVKETFGDGGYTIYNYYNQDTEGTKDMQPTISVESLDKSLLTYPFNSFQLSRGLLKSREDHSMSRLVKKENYKYSIDTTKILKAIYYETHCNNNVLSDAYYKIFTYYPFLAQKTLTTYSDSGTASIVENVRYQYDTYRNLIRSDVSRRSDELIEQIIYSGNLNAGVYASMKNRNMVSYPVEKIKKRGTKAISAELITYSQTSDSLICADSVFHAALGEGSPLFVPYDGTQKDASYEGYESYVSRFDSLGNPLQVAHRSGVNDVYFWTDDGMYPCTSFSGKDVSLAVPAITYYDQTINSNTVIYSYTESDAILEFDCMEAFEMPFTLACPPGQNWCVLLQLDNNNYLSLVSINSNYLQSPWGTYAQYLSNTGTMAVSAGHHVLRLVNKEYYLANTSFPTMSNLAYTFHSKQESVGYSTPQTVMYESFESNGNADVGYFSEKAWLGSYVVTLEGGLGLHCLDYRVYQNGIWNYKTKNFTGATYIINEGNNPIDDIRVYPVESHFRTWHWRQDGTLWCQTDERGITESYNYDGKGRLICVRDYEDNPTNAYEYKMNVTVSGPDPIHPLNYIKEKTYTSSIGTNRETIHYHDGLGRIFQTVLKNGSPSGGDLLDLLEFDSSGRDSIKWQPVPVLNNYGLPHSAWILSNNLSVYDNDYPTSLISYDGSPLDRVKKKIGPGSAWHTANKGVDYEYLVNLNSAGELLVPKYIVTYGGSEITIHCGGYGAVGEYSVTKKTDEDGRVTLLFQNLNGQTAMTVSLLYSGETVDYLRTCYVYDDAERLVGVLPPLLTSVLSSGNSWSSSTLSAITDYGYYYRYDARGRMIAKKLPGADWDYYVYDRSDRVVFSQDGEQRLSGIWSFTLQDAIGRDCIKGTCSNSFNVFAGPLDDVNVFVSSSTNQQLFYYQINGGITLSNPVYYCINWWDLYNPLINYQLSNLFYYTPENEYGAQYAKSPRGLRTLNLSRVVDNSSGNQYIWSAYYYDEKRQLVQKVMGTHLNGMEREYIGYDFTGNVTGRKMIHTTTANESLTERYSYTYDDWGRLQTTTYTLGENSSVILANNTYDSVGRLIRDTRNGIDKLDTRYDYNVRGWLTGTHVGYDSTHGISGTLFSELLYYNSNIPSASTTLQWGGNISGCSWSVGQGGTIRRGSYIYDSLSRLTSADYSEGESSAILQSCSYGYDRHNNLTSLACPIGSYTYTHAGNQMTTSFSTVDMSTLQYGYDRDGRMNSCSGQWTSTYNVLGLLASKTFAGSTTSWVYLSDGTKLRRINVNASTDYVGNLVYENGSLSKILVDGGFVDMTGNTPQMRFYVKDHLGSNRLVVDAQGNILQENHYDPYGQDMTFSGMSQSTANSDYKFGGKEWDVLAGSYGFTARNYNPLMGRWTTMDPLAEKYYSISPYAYCASNPVNIVDPEGRDWYTNNETGYYTWFEGNEEIEGYTYYGGKGSLFGEAEDMINVLFEEMNKNDKVDNQKGLYRNGFTLAIRDSSTRALSGGANKMGLFGEFVFNEGPEYSVFLEDHPYTEDLKNNTHIRNSQNKIIASKSGYFITSREWGPKDVPKTDIFSEQFMGSFTYYGKRNKENTVLHNVVFDSKSLYSLFYHLPIIKNKERSQNNHFGNTYQFYIWDTKL